ncbi:MAG: aminoglycoside phosphotransferase [Phycisphaerales bacterium]|nr:aminoglycoside phosphotransferase [Phycisphaerales bacterium]
MIETAQRMARQAIAREAWAPGLRVIEVRPNAYASSFATWILACVTADEIPIRLFCKRGRGSSYDSHGHKNGVVYEAEVYQRVLRHSQMTTATCYGESVDDDGDTWLFLECLDEHSRWTLTKEPDAYAVRLAKWLGHFHAEQERSLQEFEPEWISQRTAAYFQRWVVRAVRFAEPVRAEFPWLEALSKRAEGVLPDLLHAPRTLIHGELFPQNVLVHGEHVWPVDWESASVGAGEEDLASMTDNWPTAVVTACEHTYSHARWPTAPPAAFARRLAIARLFHQFRWLGENPQYTVGRAKWRFEALRRSAQSLDLVD